MTLPYRPLLPRAATVAELRADVRLIAAAPAMRAVLEKIVEGRTNWLELRREAREAIALAKGTEI